MQAKMTVIPRDKGSLGEQRINEKIKEKVQTMIAEMEAESDFFKAAPARTLPNFDSAGELTVLSSEYHVVQSRTRSAFSWSLFCSHNQLETLE
jgi:hypothetical protein